MSNKFKTLIVILIIALLCVSCTKEEVVWEDPLYFEYLPEQPIMFEIEVIPMEDVVIDFDGMVKEVNADYYNRYGIGITAALKDRDTLSQRNKFENEIFLPYNRTREEREVISVYVIPKEFLYWEAGAYAIISHNAIVLREDFQVNRTLAHELGHLFGLEHNDINNNVMRINKRAEQTDVPNDFNEEQIETIINYLSTH